MSANARIYQQLQKGNGESRASPPRYTPLTGSPSPAPRRYAAINGACDYKEAR